MNTGNSTKGARTAMIKGVETVFSSLWISLIVTGFILVALGFLAFENVVAGMFGIWGTTAVTIGATGYIIVWFAQS